MTETRTVTGRCLCGGVGWSATGNLSPLSHCHCSMCRKAHGAAFATYTQCAGADLTWSGDRALIADYRSSEDITRRFCRQCGSTLPGTILSNGQMFLPMGAHDNGSGLSGGEHIFTAAKLPWLDIGDELPQHDAYPAESSHFKTYDPAPPPETDIPGLRGSCLCGTVRFVVRPEFSAIHNCHCTRCRRTRGAAFTTNGFVPDDAVTFLSGEDHVVRYNLPGARIFAACFCDICGGGVARIDSFRGLANIPMAVLDDPAPRGPDDHIFTASKADWWDIPDDLPRFSEAPG